MGYEIRDYQDSRLFKGECFYCAGFDHDKDVCENNPNNIKDEDDGLNETRSNSTHQVKLNR